MNYTIADIYGGGRAVVDENQIAVIIYYGESAQQQAEKAIEELINSIEVESIS
jgi:hypothetical protein